MSQIIDYFLAHPEHLQFLSKGTCDQLLELAKMERARLKQGWLPQSAVDALTSVVDDRLMADIVADGLLVITDRYDDRDLGLAQGAVRHGGAPRNRGTSPN